MLPAFVVTRWRVLTGSACGVALAIGVWRGASPLWVAAATHPYFSVAHIELSGNRRLTRDEVLDWAAVHDGSSIWTANPARLRIQLERHPWIERATVKRELPRRLSIRVRERAPVAIASMAGQLQYVDRGARILGSLREEDSRDFPIISGLDEISGTSFSQVALHRSLRLLRWCERLRCFDEISEIQVDRNRGLTVFPLRTPVPVVMGWGNWRNKLSRSARVFAAWQGQLDRLEQVDVSFRDLAVVRLRQESSKPSSPRRRGMRI